jgi:anti-sigma factor RsiW
MSGQLPTEECAVVAAGLDAYVDGELEPAERAAVERHLATCEACRAEVALLSLVEQSLQYLARPEPSEAMRERLLARVAADLAPRRVEIFCVERHGQQVARRHEVRRSTEAPAQASLAAGSTHFAGRIIRQYRQETASGSGLRCVIAGSYGRG